MLKDSMAFGGFSVSDLTKAQEFYGDVLGLDIKPDENMPEYVLNLQLATGADLMIYLKADHEPASFTILNFPVKDLDASVDALNQKGITMEQYDMEQMKTNEKGIVDGPGPRMAWFKDPFGNILSVLEIA